MEPLPSLESVLARLASSGVSIPSGRVRLDGYGDSSALSEELLALIRAGAKRAGTSLLWACEADGQPIPHAGDIEVVLDHRGEPAIITRITAVSIVPFNEVTGSYAAIEGEGDGSLEYWRRAHWNFFSRECRRIGREPAETMPVVCNTFEVMQVLPHSD
ncbi:MAG TPA: ASCH domain-containing protein [Casimicrobiaceae bacterium]|nr:ASCH domain-containing protein [Casimicrobiaceae bacterium]